MAFSIRNSHGHAIAAFAYHLTNVTSLKQVELEAIRTGLQWMHKLGYHDYEVQTDCQLAVQDISATDFLQMEYGNILADIHVALNKMRNVKITFAARTTNCVAHRLASFAVEQSNQFEWLDSMPIMLREVLRYDCTDL